jgi:hypothetical protein
MMTDERPKRKPVDRTGPQQIVRFPAIDGTPIQPGDWVRLKEIAGWDLSGKVREVRSVTFALTERGEPARKFVIVNPEGRAVDPDLVARFAEPGEVPRGRMRG